MFRECGILEMFRECGILEMFRECGILEMFRECGILEMFRECGIFCLSFSSVTFSNTEFNTLHNLMFVYYLFKVD
jgi:hypothetical protein